MTLSPALWRKLREPRETKWLERFAGASEAEFLSSGKWRPQDAPDKSVVQRREQVLADFGFDSSKKTAGIYPQPFWDASFLWGQSLARDPAHWLSETVASAVSNSRVNWFIKLHPTYTKRFRWGNFTEPHEIQFLNRTFGTLPPHVFLIHPSSHVAPQALFDAMDVCVTGSSTVAIEAATRGIPALTSVIGEHDRHGFTVDFDSFEEYLTQLGSIEQVQRLSPAQIELARRYAYGALLLRQFSLTSIAEEGIPGSNAYQYRPTVASAAELAAAPDVQAFLKWLEQDDIEELLVQ